MLQWLAGNAGTILICLGLAAAVFLIIRKLRRDRAQGKSSCGGSCGSCGCCGKSGGCSGCSGADPCHKQGEHGQ